MDKNYKKKWGDRKDARWVKEAPAMQQCLVHLNPNRTDCEAYLLEKFDVTELLPYLEAKNKEHPDYKTTVFQALIFAVTKMIYERPRMNWFVQGRRFYERYEISSGFVARRRFTEGSDEALMFYTPKDEDTLDTLSYSLGGQIHEMRKSEVATEGVDALLEKLKKLPRWLYMLIWKIVRTLDWFGKVPAGLMEGDPNFATVFLTNLGSVGCNAIYHHLSNYGSNSLMVAVGVIHKEQVQMPDGSMQLRDIVDIGVTIDERIGDGFYFARSIKLVKHLFAHPEMLDLPISTPSGFQY